VSDVIVAHLSDVHFGGRADLAQLAVLERFLPTLGPHVVVVSGDLTQRARHGEFQAALRFVSDLGRLAPVHVVPGNHDVQWWRTPFGILGRRILYAKWRRYFGESTSPVLELDDIVVAGMCSAHGLALASMTLNPNDLTVKGHLPASEVARVRAIFAAVPEQKIRLAVLHHNVLPGVLSDRWGLARPHAAQAGLLTLGADAVLCGHDHTEGAGLIAGRLVVSTAGTHSVRTRGGRPSAFNLLRINRRHMQIEHYSYARDEQTFRRGDTVILPRNRDAARIVGA
jgi:3',5'-cyclic AMP phosphodiesterase CpdA